MNKQGQIDKWERTGMLNHLADEKKVKMAQLMENQAASILRRHSELPPGDIDDLAGILIPMVRRVFAPEETFTYEAVPLPAGLYYPPGVEEVEDNAVAFVVERVELEGVTYDPNSKEERLWGIDHEVEMVEVLCEKMLEHEKIKGKHLFVYQPFDVIEDSTGVYRFYTRYFEAPKGSKLFDYEKERE